MRQQPYLLLVRALGVHCFSRRDLRVARRRWDLGGLVDVHHVIPRSCSSHSTLKTVGFTIDDDANFVLMPTEKAPRAMRLRADRLIHSGGHMAYNRFVWERLDEVGSQQDMARLLAHLHRSVRGTGSVIPWG